MLKRSVKKLLEPIRKDGILSVTDAVRKGRVADRTVDGRPVRWLVTNRHDEIQAKQIRDGFYELDELRCLAERLGSCQYILDVGANIGNHAIFFAKFLNPKIIKCVEPLPAARQHLLANLALNPSCFQQISIVSCGLSRSVSKGVSVSPSMYNLGMTKIEIADQGDVDLMPGDVLVGSDPIDLIKIDVEGMEFDVLHGLQKTLARSKPAVYVEVSDRSISQVRKFMSQLEYKEVMSSTAYANQTNILFQTTD